MKPSGRPSCAFWLKIEAKLASLTNPPPQKASPYDLSTQSLQCVSVERHPSA